MKFRKSILTSLYISAWLIFAAPVIAAQSLSAGVISDAGNSDAVVTAQNNGGLPAAYVAQDGEKKKPLQMLGPLRIYGTTELINQNYSTSGNETQFLSQNNLLYHDKFRQLINLRLFGDLENETRINGVFTELPYIDNEFSIAADGKKYFAHAGDANAKFESGEMTSFSKNIRGLDLGYTSGNTELGILYSNQKSKTQSETFNGRNIRGPYALRATSIVENTEVVKLNGAVLPRADYMMDYFLGQITFAETLDPSDRVEIYYEESIWLELSAGNLFGASVKQKIMGGKAKAGLSFIREDTDALQRAKVFSATKSEQKQNLQKSAAGAYVFNLGQTRLEKNYEVVSAAVPTTVYLSRDIDYSIDYASGVITFSDTSGAFSALSATSVITVVYNYYEQGYLQWIQDEELSGEGRIEYQLAYDRIYAGTEYVATYQNGDYVRRLLANSDYEINEGNNTIVFLNSNVIPSESFGRTVKISYEIVPEVDRAQQGNIAERSVSSAFGDYSSGGLNLNAEIAQSKADLRQKNVQVLEEMVAFVSDAAQREYTLQREAIYNSVEIYFDDTAIPSARQRSGTDYTLELDPVSGNTLIRFKRGIPLGTTIIANYKYKTNSAQLQDQRGGAGRLKAGYNAKDMAFNGEYMRKSAYFAPLTSYNDLETGRLFASFNYSGLKNFNFGIDYKNQTVNEDLESNYENELNQLSTRMAYTLGDGNSIVYTLEKRDRSDNRAIKLTDNNFTGHRFDLNCKLNNRIKTSALFEKRELSDKTGRTSGRDTTRGGVSMDYTRKRLGVGLMLDNSSLVSTPPAAFRNITRFSVDTFSTRLKANYNTGGNVVFNTTLDSQRIEDDRTFAVSERLDSIRAELIGSGAPAKRLTAPKSFMASFFRQDRPDPVWGNSRTDISTFRITYKTGRDFLATPSFISTKALIGAGSTSRENTTGILLQYRSGAARGWIVSTSYSGGNRSGRNVFSANSSATAYSDDQKQFSLNLNYIPSAVLGWKGIYQTTSTSGSGSADNRKSYTSSLDYHINEKTSIDFLFNREENPGSTGNRTTYQLGSDTEMDSHLRLNLSYKKQHQGGIAAQAYNGTLFTTRLIVSF